jgi:hypothetical protein
MIDQDFAGGRGLGNTIFPESTLLDGIRMRHAHQDDVTGLRHSCGRVLRNGAGGDNWFDALRLEIPNIYSPAFLEKAERHGRAHQAETDETDLWLSGHGALFS